MCGRISWLQLACQKAKTTSLWSCSSILGIPRLQPVLPASVSITLLGLSAAPCFSISSSRSSSATGGCQCSYCLLLWWSITAPSQLPTCGVLLSATVATVPVSTAGLLSWYVTMVWLPPHCGCCCFYLCFFYNGLLAGQQAWFGYHCGVTTFQYWVLLIFLFLQWHSCYPYTMLWFLP